MLWFADACRIYYVWSAHSAELDQPGMVANPARGQLNRKHFVPCPRSRLKIWSRETGSAVPSASARSHSFSTLGLNPPAFHDGVRMYRQPPLGQSVIYRGASLRTVCVHY